MPGADDPDLLLDLVRAHADTRGLLPWAEAARRLADDGTLTFPLEGPEDMEPLLTEAIANGLDDADAAFVAACIPAAVFPVRTFRQFLERALLVVEIAHRLQDPDEPAKKWR